MRLLFIYFATPLVEAKILEKMDVEHLEAPIYREIFAVPGHIKSKTSMNVVKNLGRHGDK